MKTHIQEENPMNNMKRLVAVMLVLTLALCFVACTGNDNPTTT